MGQQPVWDGEWHGTNRSGGCHTRSLVAERSGASEAAQTTFRNEGDFSAFLMRCSSLL